MEEFLALLQCFVMGGIKAFPHQLPSICFSLVISIYCYGHYDFLNTVLFSLFFSFTKPYSSNLHHVIVTFVCFISGFDALPTVLDFGGEHKDHGERKVTREETVCTLAGSWWYF